MSNNSNFSDLVSKAVLAVKAKVAEFKSNSAGVLSTRESRESDSEVEENVQVSGEDNRRTMGKRIVLSSQLECGTLETKRPVTADDKLKGSLVFQPGFAKLDQIPTFESRRQIKKQRRKEREMTKGKGWYNIPATELTEDKKNELLVIQMRGALDPKRFYKGPDIRGALPKYFQTGTIIETKADFYSGRIPKKQRKKTLVEELLADADVRRYNKRKFEEVLKTQPLKKFKKNSTDKKKNMKRIK